jgi:Ferritin-like domain
MDKLDIDAIDVDGALRDSAAQAAENASGDTRSAFLRRAGMAGGALVGGGALLGALAPNAMAFSTGDRPPAKFGKGDVGILNYALTLEYLESSFYNGATENQRKHAFIPETEPLAHTFLRTVTHDENQHVALLKKALGKKAIARPKFDFHGQNAKYKEFLTAAFTFENVGVEAYSGQAFNIKTPAYLAAALSIVTIEARHAATAGVLRNRSEYGITPHGAFDKALGATQVLKDVTGLNYIQS